MTVGLNGPKCNLAQANLARWARVTVSLNGSKCNLAQANLVKLTGGPMAHSSPSQAVPKGVSHSAPMGEEQRRGMLGVKVWFIEDHA